MQEMVEQEEEEREEEEERGERTTTARRASYLSTRNLLEAHLLATLCAMSSLS